MAFIKSISRVLSKLFFFCVACGVLAGLADDVPGLKDNGEVNWLLGFLGYIFTNAIYLIRYYPIGVIIFLLFLSGMHWLYTMPAEEKMKAEVSKRRNKKTSKRKKKSRKRSKN